MKVIGILGGIGSGKSTVAAMFGKLGCVVLDADAMVHELLNEPETVERIRKTWGEGVIDRGAVDRKALAARVFSSRTELENLQRIVHPPVVERMRAEIEECRRRGVRCVVLDAPLLLEAGLEGWCDVLVFVDVPEEERRRRLSERLSASEVDVRESRQIPLDMKRKKAHHVIDNSKSKEETFLQVQALLKTICCG